MSILPKILTDLHCHTIASDHAYSTVMELAVCAAQNGMEAIAVADHATGMSDSPHPWHFTNMKAIPRTVQGVKMLFGAELNIRNLKGEIDICEQDLKGLDLAIASIHGVCYDDNGVKDHTSAYLNVLDNPYVDILGHSGNPDCPYEIDSVLLKAKRLHKIIEINSHSFVVRPQNVEICKRIALRCKELEVAVCVNSDAHFATEVGEYAPAITMLEEMDFPEQLIVNRSLNALREYLKPRKELYQW